MKLINLRLSDPNSAVAITVEKIEGKADEEPYAETSPGLMQQASHDEIRDSKFKGGNHGLHSRILNLESVTRLLTSRIFRSKFFSQPG